jgi:hypothetical protein
MNVTMLVLLIVLGVVFLVRWGLEKRFADENRHVQHAARQKKHGQLVCHS